MAYMLYSDKRKFQEYRTKAAGEKVMRSLAKRLKKPMSSFKLMKISPPKYKVGQKVYTYQNKKVARQITKVKPTNDPMWDHHRYIIGLRDKDGYSYSSKNIGESSISRKPLK